MSQPPKTEPSRLLRFDPSRAEGMDIKSYYARSIDEAVDRATYDMGPDAMLIDSRRAPAEARHIGEYEVRFAVPAAPPEDKPQTVPKPVAAPERDLAREVARMRSELVEMRQLFRRRSGKRRDSEPATLRENKPGRITTRLLDCGFAPDLAAEIAAGIESAASGRGRQPAAEDRLLDTELRRRLGAIGGSKGGRESASIAFIGPPGCGKTTAMIKMAVRHCGPGPGPAILVNTDTFRIGAAEQMARYASILGVPLLTADTANGLRQVMETRAPRTLLLIDTPGLSGGDIEMFEPAGYFLAGCTDVEKHLILPATMHWADMLRICTRYERFRPTRLAFTHLDETDRFGALITASCRSGIPISWVSAGQRIPDDLEPASPETLARLIVAKPSEDAAEGRKKTAS
jgi:flagellar biosynthesis protein FlhF